ncbi:MAG: DUF2155 domain-containing protein [Zetaproteobacteria bacterium]|nr:DUF2155 domain-containing protein [Zetaproteobacteria bacterium]
MLMVLCFCSGCDKTQTHESIHWQLPLQSSDDSHSQNHESVLPEWASSESGSIVLTFLHRNTGKVTEIPLNKGDDVSFGEWHVRLLGLAKGLRIQSGQMIDDETVGNPAAFVELKLNGHIMYKGWLYLGFPELFGLDNPHWKVWLKDVTFREISKEGKGSLSSAG